MRAGPIRILSTRFISPQLVFCYIIFNTLHQRTEPWFSFCYLPCALRLPCGKAKRVFCYSSFQFPKQVRQAKARLLWEHGRSDVHFIADLLQSYTKFTYNNSLQWTGRGGSLHLYYTVSASAPGFQPSSTQRKQAVIHCTVFAVIAPLCQRNCLICGGCSFCLHKKAKYLGLCSASLTFN